MKVTQAIITDAGLASRFLPIVKTTPKSMLPLGAKPVIQHLVEECLEAGVSDIIIVVRADSIFTFEDYFFNLRDDLKFELEKMGKAERFEPVAELSKFPKIKFIIQDFSLPYGTAAPIISAKKILKEGEPFLVLQGDDVVFAEKRDCQVLVEEYEKDPKYSAYMITQEVTAEETKRYGMVKFKDGTDDQLDYIVEKPKAEDAPSFLASYGRFLYKYEIFDYMDVNRLGVENELWNVDALTAMAKEKPVKVLKNQGLWMTTGDPLNYLKAQIRYGLLDTKIADDIKEFMQQNI